LKKLYASLDELLSDPMVEIVDVAVVPEEQRNVVTKVIAAKKPLLCQKPFSINYAHAAEMTSLAEQAGIKMAVHQQFRWSSIIQATRAIMKEGWLGDILDVQVQVSIHTPWDMWPWIASQPRLEVLFHSIHYLDSLRYLFGDPELITSRHTKNPAQKAKGESKTITTWDYSNGMQILIAICHFDWSPALYSLFRVLGTDGVMEGTIGTNYDYPDGRSDTLKFTSREHSERNFSATLPGKWIPDAFYGPMASLMDALQTDSEPLTSAKDNLGTLRVVEAAYRSMKEARSVSPSEITT
jgi:predicted dehydrogenase